jgi:hypothetical protein
VSLVTETPETPSSKTASWVRKLWRALFIALIGGVSLVALLVIGLGILLWVLSPPSFNTLARRFPNQRRDLETIISMSDHDIQLISIDPSWLATRTDQYLEYSPETGITQERWEEYRRLFARNNITQGIRRDPETKDAFVIVGSFGLLNRGTSAGFLYCGPGPNHAYLPCSSSQSSGEHPFEPGDEAYSFRKLSDRWFAYSQGPG